MDGYYFSNLAIDVLPVSNILYSLSNHHLYLACWDHQTESDLFPKKKSFCFWLHVVIH